MDKIDITIKQVSRRDEGTKQLQIAKQKVTVPVHSQLVLEFSGSTSNTILVNTFKRVMSDNIPTYAAGFDNINITQNTSIFNNDQMRLRLAQLPILDTPLDLDYLDPEHYYTQENYKPHKLQKIIQLVLDVENTSNTVLNVTTDHLKYYEDTELVKSKYKIPILLTQLRPKEKFKCSINPVLGVGQINNIWAGASTSFYDLDEETNKILFTIESQGQFNEYTLLNKACNYIIYKLKEFSEGVDLIKKDEIIKLDDEYKVILNLEDEDHTMGNFINNALQDHPKITFSSVNKLDHLIHDIQITVISDSNIIKHIQDQVKYLVKVIKSCQDLFIKIRK